ncbi:MAG TPA: phosphate ABC transporter ATP-binding protein PstB [Candidatus Saccharicenans sp.]|jgi:phosphate transport system ATP-binding protein|nr:phosphate ABC transporter ATP-binding protein [Candidatus Saccharicenans sp.]HNS04709.1 phosphate ABC transporter ATP-binding protein PstB [Candidatus Saccharicenans sp.]HPB59263.1 phosphate ABC transporter ATP-binding protein PstB [Candidatus Saccharicenans sp.]HQO75800.1 phosphate ABC transporter ATP-binding protein PstB [Candidatus Saccharicenans sp.]HUM79426.1 phosphate ABC transporter ATP-binding protein PstB [Candidatus Saccharicenans sp.]
MKDIAIQVINFSHFYGQQPSLKNINLDIYRGEILGIIGPARSGKSTFLTCLNRLNDLIPGSRVSGKILIDGLDIYQPEVDVAALRRRLGMVFATPVPLPMSIYDNVAFGPRLQGQTDRQKLDRLVEDCLDKAGLWAEVKDRLKTSALKLSGGQQQRLCLARVLALKPEYILLDEPTSGLDPISTMKIEATLRLLKKDYTIILVTNNTKQAARVADRTAFFLMGELIEVDETEIIFTRPSDKRTENYIEGKFG